MTRVRILTEEQKYRKAKVTKSLVNTRRNDWLSKNGPCKSCGSNENLEVDHIDPEAKKSHRIWSWCDQKREEELKKCQVLCKSCHKQKSNEYCRSKFSGVPHLDKRTISDQQLLKVMDLMKSGLSERRACAIVGISRGTFSSIKCNGYRKKVFESGLA